MTEEKQPEVPLEQVIKDREVSIDKTRDNLIFLNKELKYKEDQLKGEIIERNQSGLYNITSFPMDDKKPKHVIEIEIGMIKKIIKAKEENLKIMDDLQKESKNATKSD